jgi:aminobenzoyl-glutamate utilization protein B
MTHLRILSALAPAIVALALSAPSAADPKAALLQDLNAQQASLGAVAMTIWDFAEVGYQEEKSSALLQRTLREAGFRVEAGVAGMPTAFVAEYGAGGPVLGILAEFDALPGITQTASPERMLRTDRQAGHACGHHLFGTGSVGAALALKRLMAETGLPGRLRVYGTPAEEGGSGKVYMVREGLFADADVVLHWHAADRNAANPATSLANKSARVRFYGRSAHAAAAPERGRSALDGVEAMTFMINLLREHVPERTRMHYVITEGGKAPNVVPDFAELYLYVRHPDAAELAGIWDRVLATAQAAALGTGTEVELEVMHGNHALLPNETLARAMHRNLTAVGGYRYSEDELAFALTIEESFGDRPSALGLEQQVLPLRFDGGAGSTDVGDVSWVVPTTGLRTATWVPGTSAHSWQAIAAGGTSIGVKGMMVAAKTLALTGYDLLTDAALRDAAKAEFQERRGPNYHYVPLLGDRPPPLDYRGKAN